MPAGTIATAILDTPIGPLSVLAHGAALVGAGFTGDPGELHARLHRSLRPLPLAEAELPWLVKPLRDYFDGDLAAIDGLPVHQPATPLRERLWARLRAVQAGTTISYTGLAARTGIPGAARRRRRLRGEPGRARRAVPPRPAQRRRPRRLLLRTGA